MNFDLAGVLAGGRAAVADGVAAVEGLVWSAISECECRLVLAPAFSLSLGAGEAFSMLLLLMYSCKAFITVFGFQRR